ncbi:MAG: hypothetical protein U1E58_13790 [Tabrizicola sp.]
MTAAPNAKAFSRPVQQAGLSLMCRVVETRLALTLARKGDDLSGGARLAERSGG